MTPVKEARGLQYQWSRCTNCQCCEIICSFTNTGRFNPLKAHIAIDFENQDLSFSDDCLDCGLCADNCPFGALKKA